MTEDELKKEAEKWLCNNLHSASEEDFIKAMVDIAEPREKQIQIDAKQIRALQKQNGELTDKVKELEHQLTHRNCLDCSNHSSNLRTKNLELEKENAELKHTIATLRQEKDNVSMHAKAMEVVAETRSDQLTKAKELLKRFIELENCTLDYDDIKEAEQFISEVEK